MGANSSKLEAPKAPSLPFVSNEKKKRTCLQENIRFPLAKLKDAASGSVLQQLILCRDWQRVLIRASMFPEELRKAGTLHIYGVSLKVLPLHLACALNPPTTVVKLFLDQFIDAAAMSTTVVHKYPLPSFNRGPGIVKKKLSQWKEHQMNLFHLNKTKQSADSMDESQNSEDDADSVYFSACEEREDTADDCPYEMVSSDLSSLTSSGRIDSDDEWSCSVSSPEGEIIQLSPSGGVAMFQIDRSSFHSLEKRPYLASSISSSSSWTTASSCSPASGNSTGRSTATSSGGSSNYTTIMNASEPKEQFLVDWDFMPLLHEVANNKGFLPLHIACLYSAGEKVLDLLASAYPRAAHAEILGMLPIHLVSAGWTLPRLSELPPDDDSASQKAPASELSGSLTVLCCVAPNTVGIRSDNHGMTAAEYIEECLGDGPYKKKCMMILDGSEI